MSFTINESLELAQKCTGCAHLMDRGWAEPRCADVCANDSIIFGDENELDITNTETLHPEYELNTRVHYKGLPKRFVAGTVYDPVEKEVVIGAKCTLTGDQGNALTAITDAYGDFWFENLEVDTFSLKIEDGNKTKTISPIDTAKDVGLGDIALS